jgi:NADPH2:quinone reductase
MKLIVVNTPGGPEQMQLVDAPKPAPGPKDAVVAVAFSGVNFIDVYFRTGLYKADAPILLGSEASGTVESVGSDVTDVRPGDRVAYTMVRGSYAEYAVVPAAQLVKVPDGVDMRAAAALMLQGTTAHYLTHSTYKLQKGSTCLVHAGAGGTGGLIVQMARHLGARVLATVSTEDKAKEAKSLGADETIIYTTQDFEAEVKRLTDGKGVDVVYDSVGKTTFDKGLSVLRPRGTMALFGQSSGPVPPFDPSILNARGSLFLTRPSLAHHLLDRKELLWRVSDVFGYAASGAVKVRISGTYPLAEAASAHEVLEGRRTLGKLLLKVS